MNDHKFYQELFDSFEEIARNFVSFENNTIIYHIDDKQQKEFCKAVMEKYNNIFSYDNINNKIDYVCADDVYHSIEKMINKAYMYYCFGTRLSAISRAELIIMTSDFDIVDLI